MADRDGGQQQNLQFSQHENEREARQALLEQTAVCEGKNRGEVRAWIKDINLAEAARGGGTLCIQMEKRSCPSKR